SASSARLGTARRLRPRTSLCGLRGRKRLSRPPSRAPKSGSFGMTRALPEPDAQHGHRASGQWGDTVLTALAATADVRSIAEVNIARQETGELGSPQAGLDGKEK